MRLRFVGTTSSDGSCPTLYETDRETYVVQGYKVTDDGLLGRLRDLAPGEAFVEVPPGLLAFAPDAHDLALTADSRAAMFTTDCGTYVVRGSQVTDPEALDQLRDVLPGETFVEVPPAVFAHVPDFDA